MTLKCTPQVHDEQPQESLTLAKCEQYPSALPGRAGGTFGTAALELAPNVVPVAQAEQGSSG